MLVSFPAMQGVIGQRTYFSCLMKLSAIPKMFTFRDWAEFTPEDREQRVLNRKRVPDIAKYILDNEDGYIFASITASFRCRVNFKPVGEGSLLGTLEMDFEDANFVINDGQHRCAAIAAAIKENPALGEEAISVLLFPYENRARVQQMFSDLNRFVVKTSKSLDILYDKRDPMSLVTLEVCEKVPVFRDQVDKDAVSLPVRSPKLFSLSSLYDANSELLRDRVETASHHEMVAAAVDYWTAVSKAVPAWGKVKAGELKAMDLRQGSISSHSVVLRAIGGIGGELIKDHPDNWQGKLLDFSTVDWNKSNHDWENICIVAGSVVSNRQARLATKAYLKKHIGLPLTDPERRCLPANCEAASASNTTQAAPGGSLFSFQFQINKSFHDYPSHPITIPKQFHRELQALCPSVKLRDKCSVLVRTPDAEIPDAWLYRAESGAPDSPSEYWQIRFQTKSSLFLSAKSIGHQVVISASQGEHGGLVFRIGEMQATGGAN